MCDLCDHFVFVVTLCQISTNNMSQENICELVTPVVSNHFDLLTDGQISLKQQLMNYSKDGFIGPPCVSVVIDPGPSE